MKKMNVGRARDLRRASTDAEQLLWGRLRNRGLDGYKFARQEPLDRYIVDFVCRRRKLVVEIDGGQHAASTSDATGTAALESRGYRVIRFWNNDVMRNLDGVLVRLREELAAPPHPNPLPVGEREHGPGA